MRRGSSVSGDTHNNAPKHLSSPNVFTMTEAGMPAFRQSSDGEDRASDGDFDPNVELEQTEGLLSSGIHKRILKGGWFGGAYRESSISKTQQNRLILFFIVLIVTILGVSFFLITLIGSCGFFTSTECLVQPAQKQQKPTDFRRPQTDYLLDPKWDFNAKPTTRRYHFTVSDMEANPDGVFRPMILINGQFPGPLIECNDGDRLVIEVENRGINSTSLHWHGLYQNGSNWMDGTVGVTQCPIAPGGNFTYDFTISGQHGTYWYHSHEGLQASDGLVGPLIIHSPQEKENQKIPYSTDRVLMFQDYYHDLSSALLPQYLANDRENNEPIPDGALINGANIRDCSGVPSRRCDNSSAYIPTFDLAPNQHHRLRIINTAALAEFQIQIDEHFFAVTEVDGTDVLPSYINRLKINTAQRYSLIVSTNVTTADSFWLRARMVSDCFSPVFPNPDLISGINAVIRYRAEPEKLGTNAASVLPTSNDWGMAIEQICLDLNATDLVPVPAVPAPLHADEFHSLVVNFKIGNWRLSRGFFNETSYRPDVHSSMLDRFVAGYKLTNDVASAAQNVFHHRTERVLRVEGIKTIDILIQNLNEGNHPIHLHGYKFFVLGQGHGYFDHSTYGSIDLTNPLRRDTASLEGYGWMLIRLVTDNPGLWALHCHIAWHSEAGLQMQLFTLPEVVGSWDLPQANTDLCRAEGLDKGSGPPDEIYFGNVD